MGREATGGRGQGRGRGRGRGRGGFHGQGEGRDGRGRGRSSQSHRGGDRSSRRARPLNQQLFGKPVQAGRVRSEMTNPRISHVGSSATIIAEATRLALSKQLQEFKDNLDGQQQLSFPASLAKEERAWIHNQCKVLGLKSKSHGKGEKRSLIVSRMVSSHRGTNFIDLPVKSFEKDLDRLRSLLGGKRENKNRRKVRQTMGHEANWPPRDLSKRNPPGAHTDTKMLTKRKTLPSYKARSDILSAINQSQVLVLTGETGCGKTTQVPQFIVEDAAEKNQPCYIVCTQPRRLAAIAVAHRVAQERGTKLGTEVGYNVRLDSCYSSKTNVLFATSGLFLKILTDNPALEGITHLVVDEVHERNRHSDFILILVRELIKSRPELKIILMSATIQADTFTKYFDDCKHIHVKGFTHNVEDFYLDSILTLVTSQPTKYKPKKNKKESSLMDAELFKAWTAQSDIDLEQHMGAIQSLLDQNVDVNYQHSSTNISALMVAAAKGLEDKCELLILLGASPLLQASNGWKASQFATHFGFSTLGSSIGSKIKEDLVLNYQATFDDEEVDIELCSKLIFEIHHSMPLEQSVLVFLPGYETIVQLVEILGEMPQCKAIPLHSSVSPKEQRLVFQSFPGYRKVVCSTNIAETSLTIDDIVYVIDSGKVKEHSYDPATGVDALVPKWISAASAKQRRGRAGRTQDGICYHMFSAPRNAALDPFDTPELLRTPLTELCLCASILTTEFSLSIEEFLSKAPDPPHPVATSHAIDILKKVGALDDSEAVTDFGRTLSNLSLDPQLAKMVVLGCLFGCLEPMLIVAAAQANRDPFQNPLNPKLRLAAARTQAELFGRGSGFDHLSVITAFKKWKKSGKNRKFCDQYFLSFESLRTMDGIVRQIKGQLSKVGILKLDAENAGMNLEQANRNAENLNAINAALISGLYPNVAVSQPGTKSTYHTYHKMKANGPTISSGSQWVVFDKVFRAGRSSLVGVTTVNCISCLVFGAQSLDFAVCEVDEEVDDDEHQDDQELMVVDVDSFVTCTASAEVAVTIQELHDLWQKVLRAFISDPTQVNNNVLHACDVLCKLVMNETEAAHSNILI